jgi:hypothetical protein
MTGFQGEALKDGRTSALRAAKKSAQAHARPERIPEDRATRAYRGAYDTRRQMPCPIPAQRASLAPSLIGLLDLWLSYSLLQRRRERE